jgi:copper transport protein
MGSILPGRARRAVAVLLVAGAALLLGAPAASAHAQLESSDPGAGEVLPVAPRQVTLVFGEAVEPSANSIQVFDDHLRRVPTGPASTVGANGDGLTASLPPGLAKGTYTVSWQVSSADTHPVSGSFQFSVGSASTVTGRVLTAPRNDLAGLLLGGMRGVGYVGLALGPGLLLVVLGLWRKGLSDRRTRRLIWVGLGLLVASTMGAQLFQGVWASGQPLSAIFSSGGSLSTHSRRLDQLYAVRYFLAFAFVCAFAVTLLSPQAPPSPAARGTRDATPEDLPPQRTNGRPSWVLLLAAVASVALMATWALAGHAATGSASPVAVAVNILHLMAISTWLGGLALVAVSLRPASRADDLATVLPHFSRLAFACVTTIVLTGTYLAWREVGSIAALRSTEYGHLLLVKLIGVVALIALGNLGRRWVQRHLSSVTRRPILFPAAALGIVPVQEMTFRPVEYGQPELARLHRGVLAELGIAGLVLALSSALVVVLPARQDYVAPFHKTFAASAVSVDLDVASPRVGDSVLRVTVHTPDGRPIRVTAVSGSITLASARLGPLALQPVSQGGASTTGVTDMKVTLPARGVWTLELTVQTSALDATALSTKLPVS